MTKIHRPLAPCCAAEPLEPAEIAETAPPPPPPPQPPAWLQRKVVVCVRDADTREDLTFRLLEDVRCLMTFEVRSDSVQQKARAAKMATWHAGACETRKVQAASVWEASATVGTSSGSAMAGATVLRMHLSS